MPLQENLFQEETESAVVEKSPAVELKGSVFTLPILRFVRADLDAIEQALSERLSQSKNFFRHAPVVLDLELLDEADEFDFTRLCRLLRQLDLVPVGVRQASESQQTAAVAAGLAVLKGGAVQASTTEVDKRESSAGRVKEVRVPAKARIVEQPVRSGQQIYAPGGDLIVLAPVSAGAEVIADGNIHIYAPLRGRALAGVLGDCSARIIAQSMMAELVSIAGHYQIFDEPPAAEVFARPAQVYLKEMNITLEPLPA